jgi:hypothetical protein
MKIISTLSIAIILIHLNGCNLIVLKKSESNCDNNKILRIATLDIYKIDPIFYNYLDTIIDYEVDKPYFNKCSSYFLFSTSLIQSTENLGLDEILITTINKYMYDYTRCYGIYKYNGYTFLCDSLCDKSLLEKTNKKAIIKYLELDKYIWQADIDDRFSTWYFITKNNNVIKTGHYYPSNN